MAIVKKLKQHPPLPPSRYEVGIYCRVSTASKTQVVSIGHQLSGLIADVANSQQARLYDVYLDIQSGRTSDNRKNLMRLLDDCRAGRVTLVYTKSISRIARNTVDVLTMVRELQKMNCHVWDEWMRPDGTIGKAYGYQIRKYKQVDKLLDMLKTDPQNRRMIVSLWNIEDLPDMALQPAPTRPCGTSPTDA